jgi:hypothetical protein
MLPAGTCFRSKGSAIPAQHFEIGAYRPAENAFFGVTNRIPTGRNDQIMPRVLSGPASGSISSQ